MGLFSEVFTNIFGDNEIAGHTPDAESDYYLVEDAEQDHNYWWDKLASTLIALSNDPSKSFWILYGGGVTDGGGGTVDIAEAVCIGMDDNDKPRIFKVPAQTGVALPGGWNDNRQIWVIGKYDFKLGTLTRNHFVGPLYHYQLEDTYYGDDDGYASGDATDQFLDADPGDTVVCLGSFKMNVAVFAYQTGERTRNYVGAGEVPIGSIIAWLPGSFGDGSNGSYSGATISLGSKFVKCNGAALNDVESPIYEVASRYLPNLTDSRFLMGNTTGNAGTIGGANSHTTPAHYHGMGTGADLNITTSGIHGHYLDYKTPGGGLFNTVYDLSLSGTSSAGMDYWAVISGNGEHTHASNYFSGRIGLITGGVDGNVAFGSMSNIPLYLSIIYLQRIK